MHTYNKTKVIHIFYRKDILTLHVPYNVHYIIVTSSSDVSEYEIEQTFYIYNHPFTFTLSPAIPSLSLYLPFDMKGQFLNMYFIELLLNIFLVKTTAEQSKHTGQINISSILTNAPCSFSIYRNRQFFHRH